MKLSFLLLALWHAYTIAQTATATATVTVTATASTPDNESIASGIAIPTVAVWLNVSSGAPISMQNAFATCISIQLYLTCSVSGICGDFYDHQVGYTAGPNWFVSRYGVGGEGNPTQFETQQSCSLVGAGDSSSSSSCVGRYTTNPFRYETTDTYTPMTSVSTFAWPTAQMLLTELPVTTDLQQMLQTGACANPNAGNTALHVTGAVVLATTFCTFVLVMLL